VDDFAGLGVANDRTDRNSNRDVVAVPPGFSGTRAVKSIFRAILAAETKILERRELNGRFENNVATIAAVAAIGTATGNKFFAAKAYGTGAAMSAGDLDLGFINKSHGAGLTRCSVKIRNIYTRR
jgi:hypothetical protein